MNICIPIRTQDGFKSMIEPEFSTASYWFHFDTRSRQFKMSDISNKNQDALLQKVLCSSISRRELINLQKQGIEVLGTTALQVDAAIQAFEKGELAPLLIVRGRCNDASKNKQHHCGAECCCDGNQEHGQAPHHCNGHRKHSCKH
jgi:predicted Fe-Mo cluster-binding NifX family protein